MIIGKLISDCQGGMINTIFPLPRPAHPWPLQRYLSKSDKQINKNDQKVSQKLLIVKGIANIFFAPSKRAIGACPGQFRSQKAHGDHPKKTYFSKKWTKNCHRRSNGSTYPLTNLVFENSMFEKYLSVKQKLQYKDCFLFIAWFDPVLTGWEIPILIHSGG